MCIVVISVRSSIGWSQGHHDAILMHAMPVTERCRLQNGLPREQIKYVAKLVSSINSMPSVPSFLRRRLLGQAKGLPDGVAALRTALVEQYSGFLEFDLYQRDAYISISDNRNLQDVTSFVVQGVEKKYRFCCP